MEYDLLNIPDEVEIRRYKLRRTIPAPNSYFMAVKENEDSKDVNFVFSHTQTPIFSVSSSQQLAHPTGGKVRLAANSQFMIHQKERTIQ